MKVVITAREFSGPSPEVIEWLQEQGLEVIDLSNAGFSSSTTDEEMIEAVGDADGLINALEKASEPVFKACKNLKYVSRRGVGLDSVDVDYCRNHGIKVARARGTIESSVGEGVMAYILYFARRVDLQSEYMHKGEWRRMFMPGAKTRTLGLVGYGALGHEIAKRASAFEMNIIYNRQHPSEEELAGKADQYGAVYKPLDELLAESDYTCVCVPLTEETTYLINRDFIGKMKDGSILFNIARGRVGDEEAIREALESGKLAGAAVDVFDKEPCTDSKLIGAPNCILTPHTTPFTLENFKASNWLAAKNLVGLMKGDIDEKCLVVG